MGENYWGKKEPSPIKLNEINYYIQDKKYKHNFTPISKFMSLFTLAIVER